MRKYEIKFEPVTISDEVYIKYNIYYYINGEIETKEFHSTDGINGEIRQGYEEI
jgi:hypothetical protein